MGQIHQTDSYTLTTYPEQDCDYYPVGICLSEMIWLLLWI